MKKAIVVLLLCQMALAGYIIQLETRLTEMAEATRSRASRRDLSGLASKRHTHQATDLSGLASAYHTHDQTDLSGVAFELHSHDTKEHSHEFDNWIDSHSHSSLASESHTHRAAEVRGVASESHMHGAAEVWGVASESHMHGAAEVWGVAFDSHDHSIYFELQSAIRSHERRHH